MIDLEQNQTAIVATFSVVLQVRLMPRRQTMA
jgi:hypothetical protein